MTPRILFVCLGNICRSPAAEGILRHHAPDLAIDSAGTADWNIGRPPYGPMQAAARARGYDLSNLRARQITSGDFDAFDLILAMDGDNLGQIERRRPSGSAAALRLFTDYAPGTGAADVPDPYFTRDFDAALDLIEVAVKGLLAQVAQ